jgi:hypothetical protein
MTRDHPHDEQLSAYLDGEQRDEASDAAAPGETLPAHLAACVACRQRLDALGRARDLVRRPVPPVPSSVKEAAVAAALAEGLATGNGRRSAPAASRGRRWTRSPGLVVGAAAVAILAVTIGVAVALSHGRSPTATSAAATHAPSRTGPTENREPAALAPTGAPDLGSIGSVGVLRSRLTPLLGSQKDSAAATGAPGPSAGTQSTSSAVPSGGFTTAGSVPAGLATCAAAAQRVPGAANTVALVATATYGRTPALVVVVQVTGTTTKPEPPLLVVVVARSGCRVLARTSL